MKKLICFDLDGTLTPTGTPLAQENRQLLDRLSHRYRLLMVSARAAGRIAEQMAYYPIHIIGNYGMEEGVAREGAFFPFVQKSSPSTAPSSRSGSPACVSSTAIPTTAATR